MDVARATQCLDGIVGAVKWLGEGRRAKIAASSGCPALALGFYFKRELEKIDLVLGRSSQELVLAQNVAVSLVSKSFT